MKLKKSLVAFTPLLTLTGIPDSLAQTASNNDSQENFFEEVVVTAQKREQSIYEVPVAISAFSSDQIEKQGISGLIDIGKFVPNLNVTGFGGGQVTSANPFIRGIGLQDHLITTDPGVGVYVDGVYLGRQLGQNLSLASTERVEVLRGPQGTLYGRNSIGGAINIITRKPGDGDDFAKLSLQAGSRGRANASLYGSYQINDQLAISASGSFESRDGVGDFVNVDTSTEVGEFEDLSGRISILWTPSDSFSLLLSADANDAESGLGPYRTLIDEIPNGAPAQAGLSNADQPADPYDNATGEADLVDNENSASGVSITADWTISDTLNLKVIASDRTSDYTTGLDDDGTITNFLAFGEEGEADQSSFEVQLNGTYDKWDFVSGVYFFEEDGFALQPNFTFNGGPGSETLSQETTSQAIYANIGYNVSDKLRLGGGIRFTEDEKEAAVDINFGLIQATAEETFTETSWDLSATYELDSGMSTYASISNGFQSGQFNPRPFCLFGSFDFATGVLDPVNCFDQDLDNITALNYEVGIKGQLTNSLQMSLAVFNTEYSDLPYQVSTTTANGFNTVNIIVDQTSRGLEWESSWRIVSDFFLNTSLGYIDVDVDDENAVAPLTPEITASISPQYAFSVATGGTVTLRADYSYRDDMFGEPSDDPGRLTSLNSRDLVNFDVSYLSPDESWTVGLYGRNIFDEKYENARLNTGDYILVILNNDRSEFGLRFTKEF
ncbi:TonB-dependent receptor [Agarilytica rhodophyticola]|uniref:TonB-dependent receptor n=1 Tax=Agarilytica rhodophyticola TaxID=1737490 RepID=UPI000B3423E6|nr:TonB-dependent receptor [Agarilytica rhodophyticola]